MWPLGSPERGRQGSISQSGHFAHDCGTFLPNEHQCRFYTWCTGESWKEGNKNKSKKKDLFFWIKKRHQAASGFHGLIWIHMRKQSTKTENIVKKHTRLSFHYFVHFIACAVLFVSLLSHMCYFVWWQFAELFAAH